MIDQLMNVCRRFDWVHASHLKISQRTKRKDRSLFQDNGNDQINVSTLSSDRGRIKKNSSYPVDENPSEIILKFSFFFFYSCLIIEEFSATRLLSKTKKCCCDKIQLINLFSLDEMSVFIFFSVSLVDYQIIN